VHQQFLEQTTTEHRRQLKEKRGGISLQTLNRHRLAFDASKNQWLIPFKNRKGGVVNLQLYSLANGKKYNLPGLATSIYGLDRLSSDKKKILYLCEGPFDAIALDYHFRTKRGKYDILASPGAFQEKWTEYFEGRKVFALYDNDKGGDAHRERVQKLLGESRVAKELRVLKWPSDFQDGFDINDLVSQYPDTSVAGFVRKHSVKVVKEPKLVLWHGKDLKATAQEAIDWPWPDHLRCGTYVSFSGQQGTLKSTLAGEITARYTQGTPMPGCKKAGMPAGHVLYIIAEDDRASMVERLEVAGANLDRVTLMPAILKDGNPLNLLDHLEEIEQTIQEFGTRLVVIDGQNSVVGAPDISTDMKGRFNVTNRLHQFAQKLNVCLVGIRNEDPTGRAMGSQSMGDISRCVLRAVEKKPDKKDRYFQLVFVKVSDSAPKTHPPIPYSVEDLGGRRRRILWGKSKAQAIALGRTKGKQRSKR